jgi:hypothetical protein
MLVNDATGSATDESIGKFPSIVATLEILVSVLENTCLSAAFASADWKTCGAPLGPLKGPSDAD